ncbi:MAG TPA: exosortase K [Pyrinomonadaceae bacterium]|nr:exosortase K [Pyrinomonadaceae bacterium]
MNTKSNWKRAAQFAVVLLSALALKQYYSNASVNQLRWILTPTTLVVEFLTGSKFEFESHAGYMSSDHRFVIAASCAGVNFLLTAFLMLSLRKLWSARASSWRFIPFAALVAYLATVIANTVRISTALQLQRMNVEISWLSANQLHRAEGIFIYFGFLLLLFLLSERISRPSPQASDLSDTDRRRTATLQVGRSSLLRQSFLPLLIYYATTLGIPIVTTAYRSGPAPAEFWEHSVFVLLAPLILFVPLAAFQFVIANREKCGRNAQGHVVSRPVRQSSALNSGF